MLLTRLRWQAVTTMSDHVRGFRTRAFVCGRCTDSLIRQADIRMPHETEYKHPLPGHLQGARVEFKGRNPVSQKLDCIQCRTPLNGTAGEFVLVVDLDPTGR